METEDRVMTVKELSVYLNVHPSTIYRMLKHNEIPGFRVGSDHRFRTSTIDKWMTEREHATK